MNKKKAQKSVDDVLYIYGRQPVIEALRSDCDVQSLWLADDARGGSVGYIERLAGQRQVPLLRIAKNQLQQYVGAVVHQGVAARVKLRPYLDKEEFNALLRAGGPPLILILDQIQDPHNLGAIIRSAEISGVHCIVLPEKGSAGLNATVVKTSAGALFHIPFFTTPRLTDTLQQLQAQGVTIAALLPKAQQTIFETDLNVPLALLVGNEGSGVRKNLLSFCTLTMSIPQIGKVASLNASVSAAVVLFEIMRQKRFA